MEYPAFVGASYMSQSVTADQERTVNFYVERLESPGASARFALYPTPGVTKLVEAANGPGRAHFFQAGREFAVIYTTLWEISQAGIMTSRGTVAIGADPATICSSGDGGDQLFITSGGNGYIFTLSTNTLSTVAALNGKASMGGFLDGYFLALNRTTSTFYSSELLNGTTWNTGTMFAQRSGSSDPWLSMKIVGSYIWLLGEATSEVWFNAGTASFPFELHPSGRIPYGIAAPFAVAETEGSIMWLHSSKLGDGKVLNSPGFSPEDVADYPLKYALNRYSKVDDAVMETYSDFGHTFALLTFPTVDTTWTWDSGMGLWSERLTWIAEQNKFVSWRPRWHAFAYGEHRFLDASTGSVYRLNYDAGMTDVDARPVRRMRRAPGLTYENRLIRYPGFELDLEPGVASATGQGANPQVMLRMSDDGGKTWGTERMRSAGKIGEYGKRVRWERCGAARRRVFEITMTDPVPYRITGAYLTPDPLGIPQRRAA